MYSDYHRHLCCDNLDLFSHVHLIVLSPRAIRNAKLPGHMTTEFFGSEDLYLKKGITPKKYYSDLVKIVKKCNPQTIILFTMNKPVSRFIVDHFGLLSIELWEDGIGHYLSKKSSIKALIKNYAKKVVGFYPNGINNASYGLDRVRIRDRFLRKNLKHRRIIAKDGARILIGQPVVEDGYLKQKDYDFLVKRLVSRGFIYLAHPREKPSVFKINLRSLNINSAEEYIDRYGCSVIASVFSTVNFNVKVEHNFLLSSIMGLHDISNSLFYIAKEAEVDIPTHIDQILHKL